MIPKRGVSGMKNILQENSEKTCIKSLGLAGLLGGGSPCAVDVKNGKITRVRPLHYDWKYSEKELHAWKFERNGKTFEPLLKSFPAPWSLVYFTHSVNS
jgi:hypothetical protein